MYEIMYFAAVNKQDPVDLIKQRGFNLELSTPFHKYALGSLTHLKILYP